MSSNALWAPRATGAPAAAALAAAEAIARDLADDATPIPPGLNRGDAGRALFFAYLEKTLGDAAAGERARWHLERAVDGLAEQPSPAASLYHGNSGVAWVVEHITASWPTDPSEAEEEDLNEEIDAALLSRLQQSPWRGDTDLVGGLVGWGVYVLERLPGPGAAAMLPLVLARLAECGRRDAHGIFWPDPRDPRQEPDTGMAHGAAGVIALLARLLDEGSLDSAASQEASVLLAAAADGVLARPSRPAGDDHGDLAWCTGDAGLSAALFAAGRSRGREDWVSAARRLALVAAARTPGRPFDAALCHGTLGLSHLFHRLYQATGEDALLAAARRWLDLTLAQRRPGAGIGGFLCRGRQADGRVGSWADPSFLGGAAGIGLALLAAAAPVEPAWDRLLLLSGRSPAAPGSDCRTVRSGELRFPASGSSNRQTF